jgi:hypothetical protein
MAKESNGLSPLCPGIAYKLEGKTLTLVIWQDETPQASKSGKSVVLASTRGNVTFEGTKLGVNWYK